MPCHWSGYSACSFAIHHRGRPARTRSSRFVQFGAAPRKLRSTALARPRRQPWPAAVTAFAPRHGGGAGVGSWYSATRSSSPSCGSVSGRSAAPQPGVERPSWRRLPYTMSCSAPRSPGVCRCAGTRHTWCSAYLRAPPQARRRRVAAAYAWGKTPRFVSDSWDSGHHIERRMISVAQAPARDSTSGAERIPGDSGRPARKAAALIRLRSAG